MSETSGALPVAIIGPWRAQAVPDELLLKLFNRRRERHQVMSEAVWHGLRADAAIRLRQDGYAHGQISDMVAMSVEMVERHCRHADRTARGQAVLREYRERQSDKTVRSWKIVK